MSDLSERLRAHGEDMADATFIGTASLLREAADALDAAEKERDLLRALLNPFDATMNAAIVRQTGHNARDIQRIIAALQLQSALSPSTKDETK